MWTPRRVLLLLAGGAAFLVVYGVYGLFLGGIDGLPQLPAEYWPDAASRADIVVPPPQALWADQKLQQAFGPQSDVVRRNIKVEAQSGGVFLATDTCDILDDGRVKLTPLRVAIFGKSVGEGGTPEINTISSDTAYLKFDRPVRSALEMSNRKVVAAELWGHVAVINNRRTPLRDDDLFLITDGPVFYDANRNTIMTAAVVKITDPQTRPEPTRIFATGMDVYLLKEQDKPKTANNSARKGRADSVTGVERIVLRSGVQMFLWENGNNGFMSPSKGHKPPVTPAAAPAKPAPVAQIIITTDGPFTYDMVKDHAQFDLSHRPSIAPQRVVVTREVADDKGVVKNDVLDCDHLELHFSRQNKATAPANAAPASAAPEQSGGLTIESAHAWAEHNNVVVLDSSAEELHAICTQLYYDARTKTTILKSDTEIAAVKGADELRARELQLTDKDLYREVTALGPGHIDMFDKKTGKRTLHARWMNTLHSTKDGKLDCLRLTEDAAFIEDDGEPEVPGHPAVPKQILRADEIKVWLLPADPATTRANDDPQSRLRPDHVEAVGHVRADSAEMHIKEPTEHLRIIFHDQPVPRVTPVTAVAPPATGPGTAATAHPADGASKAAAAHPGSGAGTAATAVAHPATGAGTNTAHTATQPPPKQPMNLSAHFVEAEVARMADHNEVQRLHCEGDVIVHQDPASADEKGVDIRGDVLLLSRVAADAYRLNVRGDLAKVQLDKITIHGPEVDLNQQTNIAEVQGMGVMTMPASRDFNGNPLNKPSDLTIHWQEHMLFEGSARRAQFQGSVQANQGTGGLLCQEMQVSLDRPVSFKQDAKGNQNARVDHLVCDRDVFLQDNPLEDGRVVGFQSLVTPEVTMDNAAGKVLAEGPGIVHILKYGNPDDGPLAPPPGGLSQSRPPTQQKKTDTREQLTLTQVKYRGQLSGNNSQRLAIFYDDVQVIHGPADKKALLDHRLLNVDRFNLPPGYMYLSTDKLLVYNSQPSRTGGGKGQSMEAQGHVNVQAREFWGTGVRATYDEDKDMLVLEGGDGLATLYRQTTPGKSPDTFTGKRIKYWRGTNNCQVDEGGQSTFGQ